MHTRFRTNRCGLRRHRGWIAAAVLSFALGCGANTAVFSAIESTLLRPLPVPAGLAVLWESNPKISGPVARRLPVAATNFVEWRARLKSFEQIEMLRRTMENSTGCAAPESVVVARVTPGFFALMGVSIRPRDPDAPPGAFVTSAFAAKRCGRAIILNGVAYTLAGVLPADFHLPRLRQGSEEIQPDVWIVEPIRLSDDVSAWSRRNYVFARLRRNCPIQSAQSELSAVASQLAVEYPRMDAGFGAAAYPVAIEDADPALRNLLWSLHAGAILVLLLACANLAHLLLARAAARAHQTATRAALGATPLRIVADAIRESLGIGGIGASLGIAVAWGALAVVTHLAPEWSHRFREPALNLRALVYSLAASFIAILLFAAAPAWAAASASPREALNNGARSGDGPAARRLRSILAAAEAAFAVALVSAAGVSVRAALHVLSADPGYIPQHALTLRIQLPASRYSSPAEQARFCNRLLAAVAAIPGVRHTAVTTTLPAMDPLAVTPYRIAGAPDPPPGERPMSDFKGVSEDYLAATGTRLLRGRDFTSRDAMTPSPQVAIVNDALARQLPGDPLGRALFVGDGPKTIIGIVASARQVGGDAPQRPEMFLPTRQLTSMALVLRTDGDPRRMERAVTAAVRAIDPDQPVTNIRTLEQQLARGATQSRFQAILFSAFAVLALLLAAVGMYSTVSYGVRAQARELAVRVALGAPPRSILWVVIQGALSATLSGAIVGGAIAWMRGADPATITAASVALLITAGAAACLPAARAARVAARSS